MRAAVALGRRLGGLAAAAVAADASGLGARRASAQLVLPLRANVAGLERFATAVTTRIHPSTAITSRSRPWRGASAPRRRRAPRRQLPAARGSDATSRSTPPVCSPTRRCAPRARSACSAPRWRVLNRPRRRAFVAPAANAARVPAALGGAVTGVVGLDTRRCSAAPRDRRRRRQTPARCAASSAPAAAADDFVSGYRQRTGTATGCAARSPTRGFTPERVPDRLRLLAAAGLGRHRAGRAGGADRDRRLPLLGPADVRRAASGLPVPADQCATASGIKHPLAPGGETTLDLEVLDAAAPELKEIDVYESQPARLRGAGGADRAAQNRGHEPEVISASLGHLRAGAEDHDRLVGVRAAEGALALAAASGISVLASSGDDGSTRVHRPQRSARPARGQLPGLVAVRDRRRRDQRGAQPPATRSRPDRMERRARSTWPPAAAG